VTDPVRLFRVHFLVVLAAILAVAGCGGGTASTASPNPGINFTMTAQNSSGVSGTGTIVKGAGTFTVTIRLTGFKPNSSHVSHVHAGQCAQPGGIAYALQQVIADSSGSATTSSTVIATYLVPTSGWYFNVHHRPDFTDADYAPSDSCGDLSAS
jgi:CHRD domain